MDKAIVDSGTTLLRLPVNVFNAVVEAITHSSLVRCRLSTDNDEMCCQTKEMQGEDSTHSLFKDIVALRERIRSFTAIRICVCVCVPMLLFFVLIFFYFTNISTFYNCTQTVLKVNLNLGATFSINVSISLQINPKWENEREQQDLFCTELLFLYVCLLPSRLPLSLTVSVFFLSLWFRSRTFLQGSGMAPSLHAG